MDWLEILCSSFSYGRQCNNGSHTRGTYNTGVSVSNSTIAPTIKELCMIHVGQLIKQARKNAGVTQQQLAKKLKITQGAIFQYEQSETLQTATVEKIAKVLKMSLCELLECKESPHAQT